MITFDRADADFLTYVDNWNNPDLRASVASGESIVHITTRWLYGGGSIEVDRMDIRFIDGMLTKRLSGQHIDIILQATEHPHTYRSRMYVNCRLIASRIANLTNLFDDWNLPIQYLREKQLTGHFTITRHWLYWQGSECLWNERFIPIQADSMTLTHKGDTMYGTSTGGLDTWTCCLHPPTAPVFDNPPDCH